MYVLLLFYIFLILNTLVWLNRKAGNVTQYFIDIHWWTPYGIHELERSPQALYFAVLYCSKCIPIIHTVTLYLFSMTLLTVFIYFEHEFQILQWNNSESFEQLMSIIITLLVFKDKTSLKAGFRRISVYQNTLQRHKRYVVYVYCINIIIFFFLSRSGMCYIFEACFHFRFQRLLDCAKCQNRLRTEK